MPLATPAMLRTIDIPAVYDAPTFPSLTEAPSRVVGQFGVRTEVFRKPGFRRHFTITSGFALPGAIPQGQTISMGAASSKHAGRNMLGFTSRVCTTGLRVMGEDIAMETPLARPDSCTDTVCTSLGGEIPTPRKSVESKDAPATAAYLWGFTMTNFIGCARPPSPSPAMRSTSSRRPCIDDAGSGTEGRRGACQQRHPLFRGMARTVCRTGRDRISADCGSLLHVQL